MNSPQRVDTGRILATDATITKLKNSLQAALTATAFVLIAPLYEHISLWSQQTFRNVT